MTALLLDRAEKIRTTVRALAVGFSSIEEMRVWLRTRLSIGER
jgi:hypothetical protein